MRVLISADMEGITGVTYPADVHPGAPRWQQARRFMMGDINAAVRGFFRAGASAVVVNDAHADKRNLMLE
ncbi:MAG: M55 family metallopeptidase, partial [Acetobacteraceae bacterium]